MEETNRYARQCTAHEPDRRWRETNVEKVTAYFGLNILFGIKKLPDTHLYWSKDATLGVPYVQKVMPRDRFDKLTQYLHINDNEKAAPRGHRDHDKLFKIRPLFEVVNSKFLKEYQPSQNVSVDEANIAFKGQLAMKQYLPMKPVKRGSQCGCVRTLQMVLFVICKSTPQRKMTAQLNTDSVTVLFEI